MRKRTRRSMRRHEKNVQSRGKKRNDAEGKTTATTAWRARGRGARNRSDPLTEKQPVERREKNRQRRKTDEEQPRGPTHSKRR